MLRLTANEVKAKENYLPEVILDICEVKTFGVKPYIKGSWYGQLNDVSYFSAVSTDGYTVV